MPDKKILIIEDDPDHCLLLQEILEPEGYETTVAYDGVQAIQFAQKIKPDLILLDINIPAGGGKLAYTRFKQLFSTRSIPIIIITAETPKRIEEFLIENRISKEDVFFKPIDSSALLEKIASYLSS